MLNEEPPLRLALFQNAPMGGAQRAANGLAQGLLRQGVAIDFYCPSRGWRGAQGSARNQPTLRDILWDALHAYASDWEIARQIKAKRYDAVFIHPGYLGAPVLLKYLKPHVPTIYFCQEPLRIVYEADPLEISLPQEGAKKKTYRSETHQRWVQNLVRPGLRVMDRTHLNSARLVLSNSKRSQQDIQKFYGVHSEICYLGVDVEKFSPDPAVAKERAVLTVGIGGLRKGHDVLLRALAKIPADRRPGLWVVDRALSKAQRGYLESIASFLQVRLKIWDSPSDAQLLSLYQWALLFAFAPIREPFGLVVLEAMSCELPVVVVDEAGVAEAVTHNQTGLITPRTVQGISEAIDHLLVHPDQARQMGQAARSAVVKSWTWDHSADRFLQIWERYRSAGR